MSEEVTKLALECLKMDLERLKLKEEANKIMYETINKMSPMVLPLITALFESKGEVTDEVRDLIERGLGFTVKLSPSDFIDFAKSITVESLESLISDLQRILEERKQGEKE